MIDYHIHSKLCKHAQGETVEYVESARRSGISELAFTDHIPLPDNFDFTHRMADKEMDMYSRWIESAQRQFPDMIIRFGIEADYYEGYEEFLENFLSKYDFDVVIMSLHFIRSWPGENWVFNYDFPEKTQTQIYNEYLETMKKGIDTGLFDIIGHADIVKNRGESLVQLVPENVQTVLEAANKKGMAIEINTSGFRKKAEESYPGFDWLPFIKNSRIAVTTSSDAHAPEQVGFKFDELYFRLRQAGFTSLAIFEKRKMTEVAIPENKGKK